jgi:hypothetical protein
MPSSGSNKVIENTFTEEFFNFLTREIQLKTELLTSGSLENYSEYTRVVGEVNEIKRIQEEYRTLYNAFFGYNKV